MTYSRTVGNAQFDQHEVEWPHYAWCSARDAPKVLELDWFLPGTKNKSPFQLKLTNCRRYRPVNDHPQFITWRSGDEAFEQELPPYAIDDPDNLPRCITDFLVKCQPWVEEFIRDQPKDQISQLTYDEVFRWQRKQGSKLIEDALLLQYYSIMCQGWGSITDTEDLEIPRMNFSQSGPNTYEEFQSDGHRPVPQSIDHQIDVAMLKHMRMIEKRLMKSLKQKMLKNQKHLWYEIYLCYFVLLTNLEYIYHGAVGYMESQRLTVSSLLLARFDSYIIAFF